MPDPPIVESRRPVRIRTWILLGILALTAVQTGRVLYRGWVPHDEGTLAQPAARVLIQDELPHRDFDDMYTGGLSFYHAGVFQALGVRLRSLRTALFGAFLLTLPLFWYLATRFAGPVGAGIAVLLAGAWGIGVYPAAMPSWYNLFLAVAAVAAGFRYLETNQKWWLALAGACVGLSIAVKVVGLYMLAALLLFSVHREQEVTRARIMKRAGESDGSSRGHSVLVTLALALFVSAMVWLVRGLTTPATIFHFVLPPAALAGWLVWREWRMVPAVEGRTRRLAELLVPVLTGMAIPLAAFLAPYVLSGSLSELFRGVFVLPVLRFEFATREPPGLTTALPLAALLGGTAWAATTSPRVEATLGAVLGAGLLAVLALADVPQVYRGAWWLMRPLIPLLVLGGVAGLATGALCSAESSREAPASGIEANSAGGRDGLFLLLAATAMVSLVQFPTSAPVYFFYAAPMAAVLGLALAVRMPNPPRASASALAAFQVAFAVLWIHPGWIYQMGDYYAPHPPTEVLELDRGGIEIVPWEKAEIDGLVALLDQEAPGEPVWVTPDAPEVYFLIERPNPTRRLFDFFAPARDRSREGILDMLQEHGIGAVVFNTGPGQFSGLPSMEVQRAIVQRYPHGAQIGRFFVRWKESEAD